MRGTGNETKDFRIFHDFYRVGEESSFHFDIKETRKKGHDFKDYICPDTMEFEKDYFKMGNRYGKSPFFSNMRPISRTVW